MNRYVLRYEGNGPTPGQDLTRIHSTAGVKVVDDSSPRVLLVDATEAAAHELEGMPSWIVAPETTVPLPDTRQKPRRSP